MTFRHFFHLFDTCFFCFTSRYFLHMHVISKMGLRIACNELANEMQMR
jgi:hypothetical protein